jgi:hypothetical protein
LSVSDFVIVAGRHLLKFDLQSTCPVDTILHDHREGYANLGLNEPAANGPNMYLVNLSDSDCARLRLRCDGKAGDTVIVSGIVLARLDDGN